MSLTKNRMTTERRGSDFNDPVAAAKMIYLGSIVVLDAAGDAAPGSTGLNLQARGVAQQFADNSAGIAGAQNVASRAGVFIVKNDGSIDRTHIESTCFIVDDETVAATDSAGTRSAAGTIINLAFKYIHAA